MQVGIHIVYVTNGMLSYSDDCFTVMQELLLDNLFLTAANYKAYFRSTD